MAKLGKVVVVVLRVQVCDDLVDLGGIGNPICGSDSVAQQRRKRRPDFVPGAAKELVRQRLCPCLLSDFVRVYHHVPYDIVRTRQGEYSRRHVLPVLGKPLSVELVAFKSGNGGRCRGCCSRRVSGANDAPRFRDAAREPLREKRGRNFSVMDCISKVNYVRLLQGRACALVRPVSKSDAPDRQVAPRNPWGVLDMAEDELPSF